MTFSISNTLLVIAIVLFVVGALQPGILHGPVSFFNLGWSFVLAAFLFQAKNGHE